MQRRLFAGMAALVLCTSITVPLASQDITVKPGPRDHQTFVTKVAKDLDRELDRIYLSPRYHPNGIAQVRFQIDDQGRAAGISMYRRSGDRIVDQAAMTAVRHLDDLGPLPAGYPDDQLVQVNIIIAASQPELGRLTRQLEKIEAARMRQAVRSGTRPVLALTVAGSSRS